MVLHPEFDSGMLLFGEKFFFHPRLSYIPNGALAPEESSHRIMASFNAARVLHPKNICIRHCRRREDLSSGSAGIRNIRGLLFFYIPYPKSSEPFTAGGIFSPLYKEEPGILSIGTRVE
jgi:hypothetical protein